MQVSAKTKRALYLKKKKFKKSPQKVNDQIEIWASQPATLI